MKLFMADENKAGNREAARYPTFARYPTLMKVVTILNEIRYNRT